MAFHPSHSAKSWFTIYTCANQQSVHDLGKWWEQFTTGKFHPGIAFTILYESVPFTKKLLRKPETGIKDGFGKEIEHEFSSLWNMSSGKIWQPWIPFQRCSRKFSNKAISKVVFHLPSKRIFRKLFVNCKQPITLKSQPVDTDMARRKMSIVATPTFSVVFLSCKVFNCFA